MTSATESAPKDIRVIDNFLNGLSCGNLINPNRYKDIPINISTQSPINSSYFKKSHPLVISATDKNLSAKANSKNPNTTLTEFIQLPDFGRELSQAGKAAKSPNGNARALEKPSITKKGPMYSPLVAACTIAVPMIGPVQENDTSAKVNAIKKIPINPPLSANLSLPVLQLLGRVIS